MNRVIISTILLWGCSGPVPFEPTIAEHSTTQPQPQSTQLSANTQPSTLQTQPKTPSLIQSTEPQFKITTNPIYDQPQRKVVMRLDLSPTITTTTNNHSHSFGDFTTNDPLTTSVSSSTAHPTSTHPTSATFLSLATNNSTMTTGEVTVTAEYPEVLLASQANTSTSNFTYTQGSGTQCGKIYPDMRAVGTPIFRHILAKDPLEITNRTAQGIAIDTKTMLLNMMASPNRPIHPLAFFATIKHFESSADTHQWGWSDFNYFGHLCTSGECSGYFQVDVNLEPDWSLNGICGAEGLDVLNMKGGPDFCAALFWWMKGANGHKCSQLGTRESNPCRTPGYTWDVALFADAYRAYGQANQWAKYGISDSWGRAYSGGWVNGGYFKGYENCAAAYHKDLVTPAELIRQSVQAFATDIGLELTPDPDI